MKDVDAVIHLGGQSREHPWADIVQANIDGTHVLLEAARKAGVEHLVLMGSHHAVGFHTRPPAGEELPDSRLSPARHLLRREQGRHGGARQPLPRQVRHERDRDPARHLQRGPVDTRGLATWISPADLTRLVEAALTAPGFHVVWGVSDNARRWWSLGRPRPSGTSPRTTPSPVPPRSSPSTGEPDLADPLHDRVGGIFTQKELGGSW